MRMSEAIASLRWRAKRVKRALKGFRRSLYPKAVDIAQWMALTLNEGRLLGVSTSLARLGYLLLLRQRREAEANLELALGDELGKERKRAIMIGMFENLIMGLFECLRLEKMGPGQIASMVEVEGWEHIDEARRLGKGGIFVTGHMGNWELAAAYMALRGVPMNVVARRVYLDSLNERLVRMRMRHGVRTLYRDGSVLAMLRCLKRNEFLGILPDQDVRKVDGIFVDFLGHPAYTPTGPAVLSLATGAPLIPARDLREGLRHRIIIDPPLLPDPRAPREEEIFRLVSLYTKRLEEFILQRPEQWVWIHRRWRTSPEGLVEDRRE
jgi:KDO2-lipid IV(A) lauroyltransferase